jgi:two-component system sensor histidine kinase KdpD
MPKFAQIIGRWKTFLMTVRHSLDLRRRTTKRALAGTFAGCWTVAMLAFAGFVLHFNSATVGFLFLLIVVSGAILCGFWEATIVSIVACACLDYLFYPPILVFTISDPQDWVALGSFEVSALVVSRISSRERRKSREVLLQRAAMEQLYELSRSALLINMHQPPGPQLTQLIQRIFELEAVVLFNADSVATSASGIWTEREAELAKQSYLMLTDDEDEGTAISRRVLRIGPNAVGALVIRGRLSPLVMNALASMAAITLDRCVSFEKETRIEAAHQAERLRSGVLDSLAHAFKTPLTAIQTANSGLPQVGNLNAAQEELASLIGDECTELISLCTRLLQTARLEAKELHPGMEEMRVTELVSKAIREQSGRMGNHELEVNVPNTSLAIRGDRELLTMAIGQYLDNAAKYSFPRTKVRISAKESNSEVLIAVHNFGPAIPVSDRERIFQRFYRSDASSGLAEGTGIGLSAVKLAADVHRGHAWVISDADEGTTFYLSLPHSGRKQ